ncbi:hypothetical protein, partial [Blastococcus sp. CT_GayMR19]|uniref:hypothetical protein n=1 Tax=Blastococcus sp. CT_GayMR19 TaxID=2559608 RepID=UPI001FD785DC
MTPAAGRACPATSRFCPPVGSPNSVQPLGGDAVAVVLLKPTPPISIAPAVVVVTPGTVSDVAAAPVAPDAAESHG